MRLEKRILVVDDDDAIRALVSTVLRRRGFHVDLARNGVEGMDRIAHCRYSMVILDLMMPRMSGYEVLDHLRALPISARPVVLVLTAGLEPKVFDPALVIGTIHKPFDIEMLVDAVVACLTTLAGQTPGENCPPSDEMLPPQPEKTN